MKKSAVLQMRIVLILWTNWEQRYKNKGILDTPQKIIRSGENTFKTQTHNEAKQVP